MKESERVRVSGPLAKYAAGFAAKLTAQGYTDLSLRNQLLLVADFMGFRSRSCRRCSATRTSRRPASTCGQSRRVPRSIRVHGSALRRRC